MLVGASGKEWHCDAKAVDKRLVVFFCLLSFPLFLSVDLDNISALLDYAVNAWKVVSFAILMFGYLRYAMHNRVSTQIFIFFILMCILLISTLLNKGSISRFLVVWGGYYAVVLLVERYVQESPHELLLALKLVLGFIVLINFATVIAFPNGIWTTSKDLGYTMKVEGYWLLGHRNNFGVPIIAAIYACFASDLMRVGHLRLSSVAVCLASLASVLLTWSAASVVTTVLAILLVVLVDRGLKIKLFKPWVLLGSYAVADIGVVLFGIQEKFAPLIEGILHRSADLTGRTIIWHIVMEKIPESPVVGHGIQLSQNNGLTVYNSDYVHAHNGELDILYNSGLLGFSCYLALLLLATKRCSNRFDSVVVRVTFSFLILAMIHAIAGLFFSSYVCLILWLALFADSIADFDVHDKEEA